MVKLSREAPGSFFLVAPNFETLQNFQFGQFGRGDIPKFLRGHSSNRHFCTSAVQLSVRWGCDLRLLQKLDGGH